MSIVQTPTEDEGEFVLQCEGGSTPYEHRMLLELVPLVKKGLATVMRAYVDPVYTEGSDFLHVRFANRKPSFSARGNCAYAARSIIYKFLSARGFAAVQSSSGGTVWRSPRLILQEMEEALYLENEDVGLSPQERPSQRV